MRYTAKTDFGFKDVSGIVPWVDFWGSNGINMADFTWHDYKKKNPALIQCTTHFTLLIRTTKLLNLVLHTGGSHPGNACGRLEPGAKGFWDGQPSRCGSCWTFWPPCSHSLQCRWNQVFTDLYVTHWNQDNVGLGKHA